MGKQYRFIVCLCLLTRAVFSFETIVSDSPNNDLKLTLSTIASAKQSLYINVYELTSEVITDAIIDKLNEGVHVEIILEGQPIPGYKLSEKGNEMKNRIVKSMNKNSSALPKFYLMRSLNGPMKERRFYFNHAKYMIVDEEVLQIGSENYSPAGNPEPGYKGASRGWQVVIKDPQTVSLFTKMFNEDKKSGFNDIEQLVNPNLEDSLQRMFSSITSDFTGTKAQAYLNNYRLDQPKELSAQVVELLTSPNSSFTGLKAFIESAKEKLDIELMSFSENWGSQKKSSPLVKLVLDAARRGVAVRVIMNNDRVFGPPSSGKENTNNESLVNYLNGIADSESLKLQALIVNTKAVGIHHIHNKGALADGNKTLISSINWNQNSVERNREAAVNIGGEDVNAYYQSLFNFDWNKSDTLHSTK